jgi:hypothetical protein
MPQLHAVKRMCGVIALTLAVDLVGPVAVAQIGGGGSAMPPPSYFDPSLYAAGTRVQMRSPTTSALTIMTLSNDSISNVEASLWAVTPNDTVRLHAQSIPFIAAGDFVVADQIPTPFTIGRLISCVSFDWNGRTVEIIDFYTNVGHAYEQLLLGTMTKYRESVLRNHSDGSLCKGMPRSTETQ